MTEFRTRFAPSPTGLLHLGHAYSAMVAWGLAEEAGGECLLRIEDLDGSRARQEFEQAIYEDLQWMGFQWPEPVLRQSKHLIRYGSALELLSERGLTYPCSCTRADIRAALSAPQETDGSAAGSGAMIYPGTCRNRPMSDWQAGDAIRLDLGKAFDFIGNERLAFEETGSLFKGVHGVDAERLRMGIGDVVLGRKDTGAAAYHLAVVVDDAGQGITHVVRGADLWEVTPLHRVLQALLGLRAPKWHHHDLVRDENGKRLAKRDGARALRSLRENGATPADIRSMALLARGRA
ncbi:tRNA glutamyl-Q(34) synthetase GluQRS [Amaricoccus macauensis]|uniref:tRNA glutamyl-Q(34) synthetase GluQRS n=1 Tax=Amaricoccus macauensis TaxID=57001 RepID=UPI003C7EBB6A